MNTRNRIIIFLIAWLMPMAMLAQTNHWTPVSAPYEDNMSLTGVIQINGVEQQSTALEVGAFCGTECRGSARPVLFPVTGRYVFSLTIFGNDGDQITFKLYDHSQGTELNLQSPAAVTFGPNGLGSPLDPYVLNFTAVYTISASANPSAGGTVGGGGTYNYGSTCTLTATPATGYNFVRWTKNGSQVSTSASYSFTVTESASYVAVFSLKSYTISASASPSAGGSVSGGGTYSHGSTCTLTATANTGYTFTNWTKNGTVVSTNANYSFTVTGNGTYVANFSQNTYTISASANPTAGGSVSGGGTYNYGSTCTLTATPATGYNFVRWTKNGSQVSTSASYSFTVTESASYVAVFSLKSYTISASASPTAGGSVSGAGTYSHGSTCTLTATANTGYTFTNWTKNGTVVSTSANYSFTVTGNGTYVANFSQNTYTISASASPTAGGSVSGAGTYSHGSTCTLTATANTGYTFTNWTKNGTVVSTNANYSFTVTGNGTYVANFSQNTYTISASASPSAGGTVSGGGTYNHGSTCTLTATPATGYNFVRWTKNGTQVSTSASYSFTVTESASYVAVFSLKSYTISASASPSAGGTVSGAGTYNHGSTCTLTATANTGYTFTNWTKNGTVVSTSANYSFTVTGNGTYVANFSQNTYTISASASPSAGGTVSGAGTYQSGSTCTLTATPNTGYNFVRWTKNGTQVSTSASYSFTVTESASYVAVFSLKSYTISASASPSAGGTVSGAGTYNHGSTCTLTATANPGYTFTNWTKNGTVVSTSANYSFTVTGNGTYVANFSQNTYTISASANPSAGGSVSGAGTYNQGSTCTLTATANAGYIFTNWTENGEVVSTEATYSFTVTGDRDLVANFVDPNLHYYVDLGLPSGLLWATCNVGAFVPEACGDYFAWGETEPKNSYSWSTYQYCHGSSTKLTKYCNNSSYGYNGFTDNLTTLLPEDDAAKANWGDDWRIPTKEEWQELYNNTTNIWTTRNGVVGRLFTAANGNSLFLPAVGFRNNSSLTENGVAGDYLSSTLYTSIPNRAWEFNFGENNYGISSYGHRQVGLSARAVRDLPMVTVSVNPPEGGTVSGGGTYEEGATCTLTATANAGYIFTNWTENGEVVSSEATYSFTVTGDRNLVANFVDPNLHYYVDLGLPSGLLWATCNVGAFVPEACGDYFAWGETVPKNSYSWSTYQYCHGSSTKLTKYCNNSSYGYNGFTDNLTTLLPEDDAAKANWGDDWRMPTKEEWQELYNNTTSIWTTQNGVVGRLFTAANGNSLFLPAAGYRNNSSLTENGVAGDYLSSSLYTNIPNRAWEFNFGENNYGISSYGHRQVGLSARAVRDLPMVTVSVNPPEGGTVSGGGSYEEGATCMLTATANAGYIFTNWTENGEVVSTEATYSFTVTGDRDLVANFVRANIVPGQLHGVFSVGENTVVNFSQGNLQYQASTDTWRFATNQWDYVGANNANISQTYSGWIDLFGWGTSGYNHGANCYQPWSTSTSYSDYYAYGSDTYNLYNQSGQADWGYNLISNGGNTANQWRTLTQPEWNYIFNTRTTTSGIRYAKAKVNNVNGVILLPDDWSSSTYSLSNTNSSNASFSSNTLTASQWSTLEQTGAVFLPAAGYRSGTSVNNVSSAGRYWSASYYDRGSARIMGFYGSDLYTGSYGSRFYGFSVRLVRPAQSYTQTTNLTQGWNWFSTNLDITMDDLKAALREALPNANSITIKSQYYGQTIWNGRFWSGQLWSLDVTRMFKINVPADCEITLTGLPINPAEHPVAIDEGANWIGYPFSENMTITHAFTGFAVNGDKIKSNIYGQTTYNGTIWVGALHYLHPGKGYVYKSIVTGNRTFTFPIGTK